MKTIKVGDKVIYKGGWGQNAPVVAKVTGIVAGVSQGNKHNGTSVEEMNFSKLEDGHSFIFDLDNGHWGWAYQVSPID